MKIEKVNDHQIRCTLTKADLADRQLKLSELAYGTEKAKDLFRDMMHQAAVKFGFEAEDIPLMIEAIPLNGDCIVLIITKVEDPEELDTRFSKFAPSLQENEDLLEDLFSDLPEGANEVLDLFKKVQNARHSKALDDTSGSIIPETKAIPEEEVSEEDLPPADITKMISFSSLHHLSGVCKLISQFYQGINSLYKNPETGVCYLVFSQSGHEPADYNRVCNILSEYGQMERYSKAHEAFLEEHFTTLIKEKAIQSLALMEETAE